MDTAPAVATAAIPKAKAAATEAIRRETDMVVSQSEQRVGENSGFGQPQKSSLRHSRRRCAALVNTILLATGGRWKSFPVASTARGTHMPERHEEAALTGL
ncbi:hypothetical protein [Streptomyces sp. NBC_01643]|uniref:hypothetical protein n=1 Tax=Streptomyces sp. NBC_01643 TaxID=2975906 RepID=UPI003870825D|nr:hypothetical protein OHB03_21890 [Streptomyces sp. NBC_01643]